MPHRHAIDEASSRAARHRLGGMSMRGMSPPAVARNSITGGEITISLKFYQHHRRPRARHSTAMNMRLGDDV